MVPWLCRLVVDPSRQGTRATKSIIRACELIRLAPGGLGERLAELACLGDERRAGSENVERGERDR